MKNLFFFLIFFTLTELYSEENFNSKDYCDWNIGEKVKTLDKSKNYDLRLYCFVDMSSCTICTNWAKSFASLYKDSNVEVVIFVNSTQPQDAERIKKDLGWEATVIGDEFGIYNTYYKIKFPVTILILDNDGNILDLGKLGSPRMTDERVDELLDIQKKRTKTDNSKNYLKLKEISRLPVMKDTNNLLSGFWRQVLFDKKNMKYYIRNDCSIIIADSNGKIIKILGNSKFYNCFFGSQPLCWAFQDSIIAIPSLSQMESGLELEMSYLNVKNDSIYKNTIYQFSKRNELRHHCNISIEFFNDNLNEFIIHDGHKSKYNYYLNQKDTCFFVYDAEGNFKTAFGMPDEIYSKYKLTTFISHSLTSCKDGSIITLQAHTNKLQFWDKNKKPAKTKKLDLLNDFKILNHDIGDTLSEVNFDKLRNEMSQFPELFNDKSNNNLLLFWLNQTYTDENAGGFYSVGVINEPFLCLLDKDGNRLMDKNIIMPPTFKPYMVDNNLVYGTELNKNKLELVVYSLEVK